MTDSESDSDAESSYSFESHNPSASLLKKKLFNKSNASAQLEKKQWRSLFVKMATLFVVHATMRAATWKVQHERRMHAWMGETISTSVALFCLFVFMYISLRRHSSQLTLQAQSTLFLVWGIATVCNAGELCTQTWQHEVVLTISDGFIVASIWVAQGAAQSRMEMVEVAFDADLGSQQIWAARCVCATPGIGLCLLDALVVLSSSENDEVSLFLQWWEAVRCFVNVAGWFLVAGVTWRGLSILLKATFVKKTHKQAYIVAEAQWADHVIRRVRLGMLLNALGYIFIGLWFGSFQAFTLMGYDVSVFVHPYGSAIIGSCHAVIEFITLLVMVGFFRSERPKVKQLVKRSSSAVSQRSNASDSPTPAERIKSQAWLDTVRKLAERSIDVRTLLDFYERLGTEIMMNYNPLQHTTNDVVRRAIIPLSRHGDVGEAYATVAGIRDGVLPRRMVTHSWSNDFANLVAAVVADALGLEEYVGVAAALSCAHGLNELRDRLHERGVMLLKYWICAFCVNQHATICDGFGKQPLPGTSAYRQWDRGRRDTVTGQIFSCCTCIQPKYLNSANECEVNKFDDMMAFLAKGTTLVQVIAVDEHYSIFSRAWCVAELVQAYLSEIPQHVVIFSSQDLQHHEGDLATYQKLIRLSVSECSASRPEDKEAIMARIPDVQEFNAQLHALIFGSRGLFGQKFRGFDALDAAASAARRIKCTTRLGDG